MAIKPDIEAVIEHNHITAGAERMARTRRAYDEVVAAGRSLGHPFSGFDTNFRARAMVSYYRDNDLAALKRNAYLAAKSRRVVCHYEWYEIGKAFPGQLLFPLMSDNQEMIHWYGQFFISALRDKYKRQPAHTQPYQPAHFTLAMCYALLGSWDDLAEHTESALTAVPTKLKNYRCDYEFLHALSQGDGVKMEAALSELFSGKIMRHRRVELGFGDVAKALYGWGFIHTKLAWLHGYPIDIDSPWLPKALLPVEPLADEAYQSGIDVIDDFDLFTPFEDDPEKWCKNASVFSPKPLGEQLDIAALIDQVEWNK
jgi:hypothetical protein